MIQIKKTILTLVALLAVTTGAWADETPLLTIESKDNTDFKSGSKTFDDKVTVTFSNQVSNSGNDAGWYTWESSLLTVAGTNGYTITSCKFYTEGGVATTGYTIEGESPSVYLYDGYVYTDANYSVKIGALGVMKIEVYGAAASSASAVTVAWNKAEKTGSFTMPGGNVTLEPEYYPQATLAFQGLTAAEDAAAKTEAPLAVVADGAVTGGTLMYYVATDKNFSQADAIALAETQWSADIPTAETIEAAGTYIMWYYIKGDAEHSDTDPIPLAVTLLPEPTYAVTFAEGTDPNEWKADPATDVTKGQTVTVTYSGTKKVIGVKAEKKAAEPASADLSTINANYTASDGEILTGTLGANVKISIAAGATVTLDGVSINANGGWTSGEYAGITCEGNATIILSGTNAVKAFDGFYPGIYVPVGSTVTINGSGSLTASSNGGGAGIGGGWIIPCGNIEIQGGTIEATAGNEAAGIGGGTNANCGNITISGGTVTATGGDYAAGIGSGASSEASCGSITISGGTVTATGAKWAAGIGSGAFGSSCGAITITSGVTHVTATKGEEAHNSIGAGDMGSSCGTVSIDDPSKVTQN